jgi:hypothetical protein
MNLSNSFEICTNLGEMRTEPEGPGEGILFAEGEGEGDRLLVDGDEDWRLLTSLIAV